MILFYSSILLVGILFLAVWGMVIAKRHALSLKAAMVIAMGVAMVTGLLLGTVLGIYWKQMTWPTIIAIIWGILAGFLAGYPVRWVAALEGVFAGFMGGAMGPMLGVMVEQPMTMIYFLDGLSLLLIIGLFAFIRSQTQPIGREKGQELSS